MGTIKREHPNFEKITAATPKTLFFPLPFVSFVSFVVRLFQVLNSNEKYTYTFGMLPIKICQNGSILIIYSVSLLIIADY
jgi:hypothetical protein